MSIECLDETSTVGVGVRRVNGIDFFKSAGSKENEDDIQEKGRQQERPERQTRCDFLDPSRQAKMSCNHNSLLLKLKFILILQLPGYAGIQPPCNDDQGKHCYDCKHDTSKNR